MGDVVATDVPDWMGAVLTYTCSGRAGVHGMTMGAGGAGSYCVLFQGSPETAEAAAVEYLRRLGRGGFYITASSIVTNEPRFSGKAIQVVQAPLPGMQAANPQPPERPGAGG